MLEITTLIVRGPRFDRCVVVVVEDFGLNIFSIIAGSLEMFEH